MEPVMTTNLGVRARWLLAEVGVNVDPQTGLYVAELRQIFDAMEDQLKAADQTLEETVKHYQEQANAWVD